MENVFDPHKTNNHNPNLNPNLEMNNHKATIQIFQSFARYQNMIQY